jgi:putative membrane protein
MDVPTFLGAVLPGVNAGFNALSATLLLLGFIAIRLRHVRWHLRLMLSALCSSTLFLAGYLTRMALTGSHPFPGSGHVRTFYLVLLVSHMILAVVLLPLLARILYLAYHRRFDRHRWWARITWPIWMYVSVTGVVVYYMLYHLAPTLAA